MKKQLKQLRPAFKQVMDGTAVQGLDDGFFWIPVDDLKTILEISEDWGFYPFEAAVMHSNGEPILERDHAAVRIRLIPDSRFRE